MAGDYFKRVSAQTPTAFWINNVTQEQANLAIEAGAEGCTQNPAYVWKMIENAEERERIIEFIDNLTDQYDDDTDVLIALQRKLVGEISGIFMDMYKKSHGKHGYVSVQGDPFHEDTETILKTARFNREAGPNIMAKVPVTPDGLKAIGILVKEQVPINATEVLSVAQVIDVCNVYREASMGIDNPAPLYFSHIAGIFDEYLINKYEEAESGVPFDYIWQASITVAKKIDQVVRGTGLPIGFISGGARGLQHFTEMVGCHCAVTINWKGTADELLKQDPPVIQRFLAPTPYEVIDALCEEFDDFKKAYMLNGLTSSEYEDFGPVALFRSGFEKAWSNALNLIAERRKR